jgi:hypothetical protein
MPAVKKTDATTASTISSPAPAPAVSATTPAPAPTPSVEKKASNRKTFKAMSEETKGKLAEHAKTASKSHIASMRANLLLGKSWEDSHSRAVEAEKRKASKSA